MNEPTDYSILTHIAAWAGIVALLQVILSKVFCKKKVIVAIASFCLFLSGTGFIFFGLNFVLIKEGITVFTYVILSMFKIIFSWFKWFFWDRREIPLLIIILILLRFIFKKDKGLKKNNLFEWNFRQGLGNNWLIIPEAWTPGCNVHKSIELPSHNAHIPDPPPNQLHDPDSRLISLKAIPPLIDFKLECEILLENNAVFDIIFRGDLRGERGFYMARLDSRPDFYDCILIRDGGQQRWRVCNSNLPANPSPKQTPVKMKIEAIGQNIKLFRNGNLVDEVNNMEEEHGRIRLIAEQAKVYVRWINIEILKAYIEPNKNHSKNHQALIRQIENAMAQLKELNQNGDIASDEWIRSHAEWKDKTEELFLYEKLYNRFFADFKKATGGQNVSGKVLPRGKFKGKEIEGRDKHFLETLNIMDHAIKYLKQNPE